MLISFISTNVDAEYRQNEPEVLVPYSPETRNLDRDSYADEFRLNLSDTKPPKVVLFWNVSLNKGMLETKKKIKTTSVLSSGAKDIALISSKSFVGDSLLYDESSAKFLYIQSEQFDKHELEASGRAFPGSEAEVWGLESGLVKYLSKSGFVFVDREVLMQKVRSTLNVENDLTSNISKFHDFADYILEILLTKDNTTPSGWGARARLISINTGNLLFSTYSFAKSGIEEKQEIKYFPVSDGFAKKTIATNVPVEEYGRAIAIDILRALNPAIFGKSP
jgi:hypothetical protein